MKRILLIGLIASLTACSANDDQRQRNESSSTFDTAIEHIDNANAGYVADPTEGDVRDLPAYQASQLRTAIAELNKITGTGTPEQQAATALALADAHAQLGRMSSNAALDAWSTHVKKTRDLLHVATTASAQQVIADSHLAIDRNSTLAEARADVTRLKGELGRAKLAVDRINQTIGSLEAEKRRTIARRDQMVDKVRQENEKKLRASDRNERFEFQKKVEQFTRQRDAADGEIDRLDLQLLDQRNAKAIAEAELAHATERHDAAERVLTKTQARYTQHDTEAAAARSYAAELAENLGTEMDTLSAVYGDDIEKKFTESSDHFDKAVAALQKVVPAAPRELKADVQTALARTIAEAASNRLQKATLDASYLDLLNIMNSYVQLGFPQGPAADVAEAHAARATAAQSSKDAAIELYEQAIDPVGAAVSAAPDKDAKIAAHKRMLATYEALAGLTGELKYRDLIRQERQKLAEASAQ